MTERSTTCLDALLEAWPDIFQTLQVNPATPALVIPLQVTVLCTQALVEAINDLADAVRAATRDKGGEA